MDQVLMMKNVIYRRGNLVGDLTKKFDVRVGVSSFLQAAKSHGAKSTHRRRERHEQVVQLPMHRNGLGHLQKGLIPFRERFARRCGWPVHSLSVWPDYL